MKTGPAGWMVAVWLLAGLGVEAGTSTWSGATSPDWSTGANWSGGVPSNGDAVWFDESSTDNLATMNDLVALSLHGITLTDPAVHVSVGGNALTLGAGGVSLPGAYPRQLSLNVGLTLGADQTWAIGTGRQLNLDGVIDSAEDLTIDGGGTVRFADDSPLHPDWSGDIIMEAGTLISRQRSEATTDTLADLGTGTVQLRGTSSTDTVVQYRGANDGNAQGNRFANSMAVGAGQAGRVWLVAVGAGGRPFNFNGNLALGEGAELEVYSVSSQPRYMRFHSSSPNFLAGDAIFTLTGDSSVLMVENAGGTTTASNVVTVSGGGRMNVTNPDFAANLVVSGSTLHLHWTSSSTTATFKQGSFVLRDANLGLSQTGTGSLTVGRPLTVAGVASIYTGRLQTFTAVPSLTPNSDGQYSLTTLDMRPGTVLTLINDTGGTGGTAAFAASSAFGFSGAGTLIISKSGTRDYAVRFPSTWNRGAQATLAFANSSAISSYTTTATGLDVNGVIGFATYNNSFAELDTGTIGELASYSALAAGPLTTTVNYEADGGVTVDAGQTINALRITNSAPATLNLNAGTLAVQSGGVLFTGTDDYEISNGQLGANDAELILHQRGSGLLAASAALSGGAGHLTKTGTGTLRVDTAQALSGNVSVNQGVLELTGSGGFANSVTQAVHRGGTLSVAGISGSTYTLGVGQVLTGGGTLALGDKDLLVQGALAPTDGSMTFTSTGGDVELAGTLTLKINGFADGDYDQLVVGGDLVAGGTLVLENLFDFDLSMEGVTLQILDVSGDSTGAFASMEGTTIDAKMLWDTSSLLVDGTITAVPPPSGTVIFIR